MESSQLKDLVSSDEIIKAYIKKNEGYSDSIYKDTKKIPTTGYGFNIKAEHVKKYIPNDVLQGKRALKKQEADEIFEKLYSQSVKDAKQYLGGDVFNKLPNDKKQVVVDMAYNLGLPRLMGFEEMKKGILANDYNKARRELLDSKYAREDVGDRAVRNANLMYSSDSNAIMGLVSNILKRK